MNKKLYRSTNDKVFAGVCAGIAEYTDSDPSVIRILTVLLLFFTSIPIGLIYLIMCLCINERPKTNTPDWHNTSMNGDKLDKDDMLKS